jgi:protein-S-isoprenylcysteine O-methyltransferase Ste14
MAIDHVRATGAVLLVALAWSGIGFMRSHGSVHERPRGWAARAFLFFAALLHWCWLLAGLVLLARRRGIFQDTAFVHGEDAVARGAGALLFIAGNLLYFAARRALRSNLQLAATPPRDGNTLVTGGPYARIRHPIYLGEILIALGLALVVGSWIFLAIAAVILLFLPAVIAREEGQLAAAFGGAWDAHALRTRRLIPGIW